MSDVAIAARTPSDPMHADIPEGGLLVSWRNPKTNRYMLIGALQQRDVFTFSYFPQVNNRDGFLPIFEFADTQTRYESPRLFHFFDCRVMNPRRPDRNQWLQSLGATSTIEPFEILKHSFGRRVSDYYEMFAAPQHVDSQLRFEVPIHGWRYHPEGEGLILAGQLKPGTDLTIVREEANEADPRALKVSHSSGVALGYVSAAVLDYLEFTGTEWTLASAKVRRVNELRSGPHLRVVLEVLFDLK